MQTEVDVKPNVVLIRSKRAPGLKIPYPLQLDFGPKRKGWVSPRDCQRECFDSLKKKKYRIINMPTGSGKTIEVCCLAAYGLQKKQFRRAIIAVPQDVIASGFIEELTLKLPGCPEYNWDVSNNLCDVEVNQVISKILNFLRMPEEDPTLVCTHSALVRAFQILQQQEKSHLFSDIHLFIDEAHHIQNGETIHGIPVKNQLGVLTSYAIKHGIGITMTTATYARGDRVEILTDKQYDNFSRYDYPFDKYFDTLQIQYLSYDFALYDGLHHKAIAHLIKEGLLTKDNRVIFYIPKTGQAASLGTKTYDVESIRGELWRDWTDLDLVHEQGREERKQRLIEDPNLDVNAIFTMNMMEEGANWKRADTAVVIGPRYSLPGIIQKLGRLMRDFPGKKKIRLIHLLPFTFNQAKKEQHRSDLNDWLKAVLCSMMLENVFCPLKIAFKTKRGKKTGRQVKTLTKLQDLLPDSNDQHAFRVNIIDQIKNHHVENMDKVQLKKLLLEIVVDELKERDIQIKYAKLVRDQLWYEWCRKTIKKKGIDVKTINIELLEEVQNPFKALLRYTSGKVGGYTFRDIRAVIPNRCITFEDCQALAKERGGECLGISI